MNYSHHASFKVCLQIETMKSLKTTWNKLHTLNFLPQGPFTVGVGKKDLRSFKNYFVQITFT
jgi:hypothetical protein